MSPVIITASRPHRRVKAAAGGGGGGSAVDITGSVLTLTGTGFGTKSTANPLVYDDFSSGTVGNNIGGNAPIYRAISGSFTWGSTNVGGSSAPPVYSNTFLRGNSTRNSKHVTSSTGWNSSLSINPGSSLAVGGERYFSFWWRFDYQSGSINASTENIKPWVYYFYDPGIPGNNGETYDGFGDSTLQIRTHSYPSGNTYGSFNLADHYDEWIRVEVYLKQNALSSATSSHHTFIHTPNSSGVVDQQYQVDNVNMNDSFYLRNFDVGSYFNDGGGLNGDIYVDNFYMDDTRQRVELADNSTWTSRTFSEVQPATSWSNTSISCRYVKGGFASSSTAYAFVIGTDGTATYVGSVTIP